MILKVAAVGDIDVARRTSILLRRGALRSPISSASSPLKKLGDARKASIADTRLASPMPNRRMCQYFAARLRAPRIISYLQSLSGHEKAAKEAAEQENLISTIDEIS
jgi:hypothetical protein